MLWYAITSNGSRAYADQELKAWDQIKGKLPDEVIAERKAKEDAVELAIESEKAKGEIDPKALPVAITDKQVELKAILEAEATTHEFEKYDEVKKETVTETLDTPTYLCSWDGTSPFVTTIIGTFPVEGIPVMGWPQTDVEPEPPIPPTQEEIDAILATQEALRLAQEQWNIDAIEQMKNSTEEYEAWITANPYPLK